MQRDKEQMTIKISKEIKHKIQKKVISMTFLMLHCSIWEVDLEKAIDILLEYFFY